MKQYINKNESLPIVRMLLDLFGYGGHWTRKVMNQDVDHFIKTLSCEDHDTAEISGRHYSRLNWRKYQSLQYPEFDVCADIAEEEVYDLIFCEQVLEHVWQPIKALHNLRKMLKPNGILLVSTPFLVQIHKCPEDYWRFTPDCLNRMLTESGFTVKALNAWGNRACVKSNLNTDSWIKYRPFHSLKNEENVPVVVWAFAQK